MEYFLRLEQPWFTIGACIGVATAMLVRRWWTKQTRYRYSIGSRAMHEGQASRHPYQKIFYLIRLFSLAILAFLIGKPQLVDSRSNMLVEGIDIMLVLDASGSMQHQDYSDDRRSRFDVAKEEAIRFIKKRTNDALGLVVFGADAVSRCPLTLDKKILTELVNNMRIGDINPDGTMLATAMITAVNRLKSSSARSKVMILLTDGEPSDGDMNPAAACEIAKKFKIKVYTVGIGSDRDELMMHPIFGPIPKPKVNTALLEKIARETGGKSFMAHNAQDMRSIYDTIDQLEKTEHETPLYSRYFDIFSPFALGVLIAAAMQVILSSSVWFSI